MRLADRAFRRGQAQRPLDRTCPGCHGCVWVGGGGGGGGAFTDTGNGNEVTLSRWFSWDAGWKAFCPYWTFVRKVHDFRKKLSGQLAPG